MGRKTNGALAGQFKFRRSPVDGLGWVVHTCLDNTGRVYCVTDTAGGFVADPNTLLFDQIFREGVNVPANLVPDNLDGAACYSIAPSFNVPGSGTAHIMGKWWRFTNANPGVTQFAEIGGYAEELNGNDGGRMRHPVSATDDGNANHSGIVTPTGLWYIDGPGNAVKHPDIGPISGPQLRHGIAFDPSVAPVNGKRQRWYCFETGVGLKVSESGLAGSFSLVPGSPTLGQSLVVGGDGTVYVLGKEGVGQGGMDRYKPGEGWFTTTPMNVHSVAVHPTNHTWIWTVDAGGNVQFSKDRGTTTYAYKNKRRVALDVPVMASTMEGYMSAGSIAWDANRNAVIFGAGIGVWEYRNPVTDVAAIPNTTVPWVSRTKGLAQLCVDFLEVVHAPGTPYDGELIACVQDRGIFTIPRDEADTPPTGHGPSYYQALQHGSTGDYHPSAPHYRAYVGRATTHPTLGPRVAWESFEGGKPGTWTPLDNPLDAAYTGTISVGGEGRLFHTGIVPDPFDVYDNNRPTGGSEVKRAFIKKPGEPWQHANIAGGAHLGQNEYGYTSDTKRHCHDPFVPGQYFMVVYGDGGSLAGIWRVRDDGSPAVQESPKLEVPGSTNYWNIKIKPNYLRQNHFGYTAGPSGSSNSGGGGQTFLWLTRDGCKNWKKLPGFNEVHDFDFGARDVDAGESYERIYLAGYNDAGEYGCWMIYNLDLEPTVPTYQMVKLSRWPLGWIDAVQFLAADKSKLGRAYFGHGGSGWAILDYECKRRWTA